MTKSSLFRLDISAEIDFSFVDFDVIDSMSLLLSVSSDTAKLGCRLFSLSSSKRTSPEGTILFWDGMYTRYVLELGLNPKKIPCSALSGVDFKGSFIVAQHVDPKILSFE